MNGDLISIIVPVYNVERYLERCVDSIINQTYFNCEIILIDDGSTDNSARICDEYKERDSRILVIHKKNGGLSDARNKGIDIAKGKYITFIDSDDFVAEDYLEFLYDLLLSAKADVSVCLYQKYDKVSDIKKKQGIKKEETVFSGEEAVIDLCYQKNIPNSAWGKLYKRSLFENIRYPRNRLYEDLGTTYKILVQCTRVSFSSQKKYYYYQRVGSIMNKKFSESNMDRIIVSKELLNTLGRRNTVLYKAAVSRFFISNIQVLRELPLKNQNFNSDLQIIKKNIKKYRKTVLMDKSAKKINRIIAIFSCFPAEYFQKLGLLYKKVHK